MGFRFFELSLPLACMKLDETAGGNPYIFSVWTTQ